MYAVFGLRAMYGPQKSMIENYEVWAPVMNGCSTSLIQGKSREFCLGYVEGRLDLSSWYIVVDDVIVMSSKGDDDPLMWTQITKLPVDR